MYQEENDNHTLHHICNFLGRYNSVKRTNSLGVAVYSLWPKDLVLLQGHSHIRTRSQKTPVGRRPQPFSCHEAKADTEPGARRMVQYPAITAGMGAGGWTS